MSESGKIKLAFGYLNPYTQQDIQMLVTVREEGINEMLEQFANFLVACSYPEELVRSRLFPAEYEKVNKNDDNLQS